MRARRCAAVAGLTLVVLALTAVPASAHGRGSDATNFSSSVVSAPGIDGLHWRVYNGDEYLGLRNDTDTEVVILDYQRDRPQPYLRIGPDGVFENQNSQATYLNRDRYGVSTIPPSCDDVRADAAAQPPCLEVGVPDWQQVSDEPVYAWHDHRIHWMTTQLPPAVAVDPGARVTVYEYAPSSSDPCNSRLGCVPFAFGDRREELGIDLAWVPGSSAWLWVLPAAAALAVLLLPAFRTAPDAEAGRWPRLARPAAVILGVVTLGNVTHLIDDFLATPIPLSQALVSAAQTAFFIAIGLFGAVRGWQGREGAFTALGVGSAAIFIGQGLLYQSVLGASQDASIFPGWLTRVVIAASLAQALPVVAAAVAGNRRLLPDLDAEEEEESLSSAPA